MFLLLKSLLPVTPTYHVTLYNKKLFSLSTAPNIWLQFTTLSKLHRRLKPSSRNSCRVCASSGNIIKLILLHKIELL